MTEPPGREPASAPTGDRAWDTTKPVDIATHLYLLAISILVVVFAFRTAWPHLIATVVSSGILLGIQLGTRRRSPVTQAAVRFGYFVIFIPAFYLQLKSLIPAIHPQPLDDTLRALDAAIFGTDPTRALEAVAHPIATEFLQLAYTTYYILPLILPIWLLWNRRAVETEKFALALLLSYYITYLGYIAVPANGPGATIHHDLELRGLLLAEPIWNLIKEVDADRFDCFPSGHTAVAIVVAIYAWRFRMPILAPILAVDAFLIVLATVYMRYHYVVDLPPGVLLALACVAFAERVYRGRSAVSVSPS